MLRVELLGTGRDIDGSNYPRVELSTNRSVQTNNWPFAKGPTLHLLADFFIVTSQSNGPSSGCAVVTPQWNDVKRTTRSTTYPEFGERAINKGERATDRSKEMITSQKYVHKTARACSQHMTSEYRRRSLHDVRRCKRPTWQNVEETRTEMALNPRKRVNIEWRTSEN